VGQVRRKPCSLFAFRAHFGPCTTPPIALCTDQGRRSCGLQSFSGHPFRASSGNCGSSPAFLSGLTGSGNVALWVLVVVSLVVSAPSYLYAGDVEKARNDPWQLTVSGTVTKYKNSRKTVFPPVVQSPHSSHSTTKPVSRTQRIA